MAITQTVLEDNKEFKKIKLTSTADTDTVEFDISEFAGFGGDSLNNITADTLDLYFSTEKSPSWTNPTTNEYSKYVNAYGNSPFSATNDNIELDQSIQAQNKLKIYRSGSADSTINFILTLFR